MKISLIDERLSGDTGGTKPVLVVPVSQVVEKPKSRGDSFNLIGNKRPPAAPVDSFLTSYNEEPEENLDVFDFLAESPALIDKPDKP